MCLALKAMSHKHNDNKGFLYPCMDFMSHGLFFSPAIVEMPKMTPMDSSICVPWEQKQKHTEKDFSIKLICDTP